MDDLISRAHVKALVNSMWWDTIDSIPAVDAVEVVHAYWTRIDYKPCGHDYVCSACKGNNDRESQYCPDCGAHMDGRREEA